MFGLSKPKHKSQNQSLKQKQNTSLIYHQDGIIIKMKFWEHQSSQHLFDYQKDIDRLKKYRMLESSDFYYAEKMDSTGKNKKPEIIIVKAGTPCRYQYLGRLQYHKLAQQGFFKSNLPQQTYKVDRGNGFQLQLGSIIKIGRLKYRIHTFDFTFKQKKQNLTTVPRFFKKSYNLNIASVNAKGTCKFCLLENQKQDQDCQKINIDDILISPCQCKGSCERVHVGCLKYWLQQKLSKQFTDFADYYSFKNMLCQICKAQLPISIIKSKTGQKCDLINFNLPQSNYLVLQNLNPLKQQVISSSSSIEDQNNFENYQLIVLKFPQFLPRKFQLTLGRSNDCHVKLSDVSVSRLHAIIKHDDGKILLKDNGSKFGTLVQSQKVIQVTKKNNAYLQIGKTYFQFSMKNQIQDLQN